MPKVGTSISASRLRQIPAASPVQGDVFVSSQNGTDGGAGTLDAPVDSLDEVAGLVSSGDLVRLERGSTFSSQVILSGLNVTFKGYGEGALAFVDCSDELPDADWTLASGQSNTYRQDQPNPNTVGVPYPRVWEDNQELVEQESISDVESNAGSYFVDTSSDPWIIYVHPQGSTTPGTDGKLYEWTARDVAIQNVDFGQTDTYDHTVSDVVARRHLQEDGSIVVGAGGTIAQSMVIDGAKHHMIHGGGVAKDVVMQGLSDNQPGIGLIFFHGQNAPKPQPTELRRVISIQHTAVSTSQTAHTGFSPAQTYGTVEYGGGSLALSVLPGSVLRGHYHFGDGHPYRGGGNVTTRYGMIDMLGFSPGAEGLSGGPTIENHFLLDAELKRKVPSSGLTVTVKNSTIICTNRRSFINISSDTATIDFKNCLLVALNNRIVGSGYNLSGQNCIFVSGRADAETNLSSQKSLSQLQTDTGAFGNSVYCTISQWRNLLVGDWRKGDVRINGSADVTTPDGSVLSGQLPDGTPITDVGPQETWDYKDEAPRSGAPSQWPTPPTTKEEGKVYVADPDAHQWRGEPNDHRNDALLSDFLRGFWAMDGASGTDEPDQINSNDLVQQNGVGAGSTSDFPYRTFNGSDQVMTVTPGSALSESESSWWLAAPMRFGSLSGGARAIEYNGDSEGYAISSGNGVVEATLYDSIKTVILNDETISANSGEFYIVQLFDVAAEGLTGLRVGGVEKTVDTSFGGVEVGDNDLYVGGSRFDFFADVDVGPLMIAEFGPSKSDRDWLHNSGAFRTLSEIQNRTVTVKEI